MLKAPITDSLKIPGLTPAPARPTWQRCGLPPPAEELRLPDGKRLVPLPPLTMFGITGRAWGTKQGLRVLATLDPMQDSTWGELLHISLSYAGKDPTWAEIKAVKAVFFGDQDAMLILPSQADYVNIHQHCFQIIQCPEPWMR